jgi:flagellar biosynthesis repressor protein FlbT
MLLKLRAGEKLYVNGAVVRVDRKTTIELLNDATFLLETHVIQPEEASTPLRQLYFVLQTQLMERAGAPMARKMFRAMLADTGAAFGDGIIAERLRAAGALAESDRLFEAMKAIRALFSLEAELIAQGPSVTAAA